MAAREAVLSPRRLNRALLARQHLLRRTTRPLVTVLEDVGGLQVQYAPSGYVGLWTRMADFRRDRLTRALEGRRVVQATLLRSTIHLTSPEDFVLMTAGTRRARQAGWRRTARSRGLPELDHDAVGAAIRSWFDDGPLTRDQLLDRLAARGVDRAHWEGLVQDLPLLRLPPQGTWERRRAHLFGLADHELPAWRQAGEDEGLRRLAVRYLGGFGPAPVADLAQWAGVPAGAFEPVLADLPLRRFRDCEGAVLLDLPRRPIPDETVPAPVRFLPWWDATLLVHARRTGILPEAHRPAIFSSRNPHSVGTVLVDGRVVATWRPGPPGRVDVQPLEDIPRAAQDQVDAEAAALGAFTA